MTLSSRHRIRNSSPGGLRPSTLPLGHGGSPQYWLSHVDGEETFFVFFQTADTGNRTPNSGVEGSGANHYPRAPAPNTGGQHWERFHVLGRVDCLIVHGFCYYSSERRRLAVSTHGQMTLLKECSYLYVRDFSKFPLLSTVLFIHLSRIL